ncbi:MAG: HAD-IC family P-type ATPase [bacterium]|nr:HAD-IC family P-type ATPase [bacterium]
MALSWYAEDVSVVYKELQTNEAGLRADEAARRLKEDGPNALPETKTDGYPIIFLRQFQSPLIYILFAASATVFLLGETTDGLIILAVLLFNAVVGTIQEGKAQNTLRALKRYVETTATVVRDGMEISIPDYEVVRGDILVLREGEKIPSDARVISVNGLKLDEASLTGESEPVGKTADAIHKKDLPAAEQRNMVFKGTNIIVGNGQAVAMATGMHTVIGTIAKEVSAIDTEIPLKANIRYLSRAIIAVVGVISAALFLLGLIKGEEIITIFATVVSLAVSVIPEGLPIVITLVLATGVWRMSKRNALVKKLQAVEALGQARIIAVDKTGTITKNELVIREVWTDGKTFTIGGIGYEPEGSVTLDASIVDAANHPELLLVGKIAALGASARVFFSEAEKRWRVTGDPTEAAIRVFGEKVGFKKDDALREAPLVSEIPFDYRLKYHAAVFGMTEENSFLVMSGAPEAVLALCSEVRRGGRRHPLRQDDRREIERMFAEMSDRGLRVVAVAMREKFGESLAPETVRDLAFVGFFGMQDILRPEVAEAMSRASSAGIKVVMITGDYALTARAIAKEAGMWRDGDKLLTGAMIDEMSDDELKVQVATVSVFARVTPEHKLRIINAYKKRGEIVAMTGDGVNDAPSLVAADLGVAMGKIGTEVAKEAAEIVLLDDNFGSIVSAVEEGRSIYKTIKKVILYLFSTSLGEVLTITGALVLGYPLPLLAAQIIWLNFVTDGFLDVALAMEPKESGLLSGTFERSKKYLVDGLMARRMVLMALPMMFGTLFLFQTYAETDIAKAWTVSLTVLAVFQWFNVWNCRSESKSFFRMSFFSNTYLLVATAVVISLQMVAVYTPFFQRFLHTVPLNLSEWMMIIVVATSIIWVEEVRKFFYRRRNIEAPETSLAAI